MRSPTRLVALLVAVFGLLCVLFGLNVLFHPYDKGSEEMALFGWIPLILGAVAVYSGLSVFHSGRL
jgi:uncharacterized membrane protein HdeD (DUF308 family)